MLAQLAKAKRLPIEFLKSLGVQDSPVGLVIPYGKGARNQIRIGMKSKDGFRWQGNGPIFPYGVFRPVSKKLIFVEGSTDCWALWLNGFHALGLPGATTAKILELKHLNGVMTIYIWKEPDAGGKIFVDGLLKRLHAIGYTGAIRLMAMDGFKDPCDLHVFNPKDFKKVFSYAMAWAKPISYKPPEPKPARKQFIATDCNKSVAPDQIAIARKYPIYELLGIPKNKMIRCLVHSESTPSMSVKMGFGHCFSCGANVDSLRYLVDFEGLTFPQAVKDLCQR